MIKNTFYKYVSVRYLFIYLQNNSSRQSPLTFEKLDNKTTHNTIDAHAPLPFAIAIACILHPTTGNEEESAGERGMKAEKITGDRPERL